MVQRLTLRTASTAAALLLTATAAMAQVPEAAEAAEAVEAAVSTALPADGQFVMNTLLFLMGGFLVMWMAAGFAMLEAGMVRSKNVSMQCLKNICLYSIAGLAYWAIGYNLMYNGVDGGFFGVPGPVDIPDPATDSGEYAVASDWFFQMVFCATTASIVSGTIAERMKLGSFLVFVVILTGILYPITGAWQWGEGWLYEMGFSDFAGSTLVHSVGGWAALTGALIVGARKGKYSEDGRVNALPGSSMPLATLGTFILWLGWFGFNGGSQLAMGTIEDAASVAKIFMNTNLAAAGGVMAAVILCQIIYKKVDLTIALNGALAGLVSITAEPLAPSAGLSIAIGAVGGAIVVFAVPLLDKLKIDDVVGAIPVHLLAGIWGTMIVPLSNGDASYGVQLVGIVSIGAFTVVASGIVWLIIKAVIGLRVSDEEETLGLDKVEVGVEAYPEFSTGAGRI
ncbi:MAG: ammonium transporter [Salinarimonadaceae bacterium]|nr:MAG: ammonium transporter [Salinarimonadaceae bacterium]